MAKTLRVDQVGITNNDTIQICFHKLSSDGDILGNHRTSIEKNGDIDDQMNAVNSHMGSEGFAPVPQADIDRVKALAAAAWE